MPPTCTGAKKMCFAITEPNAGTNSFAMTTLATPGADGGWTLNGQKVFISGARDADFMLVVARTTKAGEVKYRTDGMSLFVVDMKTPGIKLQQLNIQVETAERQYMVFFDNVKLPADAVIGEPGKGAKLMFEGLNSERLLAAGAAIGLGDYALSKAVAYANERKPFGKPIGSYQALQHRMALAKAELEAARLMTYDAADRFDSGEDAGAHRVGASCRGKRQQRAAMARKLLQCGPQLARKDTLDRQVLERLRERLEQDLDPLLEDRRLAALGHLEHNREVATARGGKGRQVGETRRGVHLTGEKDDWAVEHGSPSLSSAVNAI